MAFFEQLGRRITDAGQEAALQAKNLADTTRLNVKISESKKKLSQLLFELGQNYYTKHKNDTDSEEQAYIDSVNSLLLEIEAYQDEIERLKAVATCKACGARISQNSVFCTNCGTKLSINQIDTGTPSVHSRKCPRCGAEVGSDPFCANCGASQFRPDVYPDFPISFPASEEAQLEVPQETCPTCSAPAEEEDLLA